jgi:hypothetical protein
MYIPVAQQEPGENQLSVVGCLGWKTTAQPVNRLSVAKFCFDPVGYNPVVLCGVHIACGCPIPVNRFDTRTGFARDTYPAVL